MARHILEEVEEDEIYHALTERKSLLEKRAKSLEEQDGLPEAAESVRQRIALYNPNGEGDAARPGLIRTFAPQRDIEAEAQAARADEERDASGAQDMFGGGAETGGGHPAGETVTVDTPKGRKGKKKKSSDRDGLVAGSIGEPDGSIAEPPDDSTALDPVERALEHLAFDADVLLNGPASIDGDAFDRFANSVLANLPIANPRIDLDMLTNQINGEFADADENAHALAYFVQRNVEMIRDDRDKPIGQREESAGTTATSGTPGSAGALKPVNMDSDIEDHGTVGTADTGSNSLNFASSSSDDSPVHGDSATETARSAK